MKKTIKEIACYTEVVASIEEFLIIQHNDAVERRNDIAEGLIAKYGSLADAKEDDYETERYHEYAMKAVQIESVIENLHKLL